MGWLASRHPGQASLEFLWLVYNRPVSQSNKGVIAVLAGGCFLGLAIGLGYLFYWAPKQKAKETRREIAEWGGHWQRARLCLLGDAPSADPLEAVAARELSSTNVKGALSGCITDLKLLAREEGSTTEEHAVEDAWYALRIPLGKLAQAHAWRTAKEPNKDQQTLWVNLATAIEDVDKGYRALYAAAGMTALKPKAKRLSPAPKVLTLTTPGSEPTAVTEVTLKDDRVTYQTNSDEGAFVAELKLDNSVSFTQLSPLALRAAEGAWGLWIEHDGIPINEHEAQPGDLVMAGPLDDLGEPAADGTILHKVATNESVRLKFAIGEASRVALFRSYIETPETLSWSRKLMSSSDNGVSWTPMSLPTGELYVSLKRSPKGNYISWQDSPTSTTLHYQELSKNGAAIQTLRFKGDRASIQNWPPELCQAPNRRWWVLDGHVYTIDENDALVAIKNRLEQDPNNYEQSMRCSDSGFAITSRSYGETYRDQLAVQTCTLKTCTTAPFRVPAPVDAKFYPLFHEGKYTVVVAMGGFAAVWTEGTETPVVIAIGSEAPITGAVSRNGSLEAFMWPPEDTAPTLLKLR